MVHLKILLLHSDFIEFEPRQKAIKSAEEAGSKQKIDECLVVLIAVESRDEANPEQAANNLAIEIKKVAGEVKASNIVLYPYAHLSKDLSSPSTALTVLKEAEKVLKKEFTVTRAPFGWYKKFSISVKGHPLAELSRDVGTEEISNALKKEETLKSEWFILDTKGKLNKIELKDKQVTGFDFAKYKNLEKAVKYEMMKSRVVDKEPPHIKLMKKLELVDYEDASDPGNFRYLPKGSLIKSLIEDFVTKKTIEYGAMQVETPAMYDYEHPALKDYLNRFPARQYTIKTPNKRVFLRFSACFGQFLAVSNAMISYRNLPLRLYELADAYRVEQRGELAGLRRLRRFTMPDCHAICKDTKQAKEEMLRRFGLANDVQEGVGITKDDLEFTIRVVKDFYEENKAFIAGLVKKWGRPVLIEIWDKKFFYFILKLEWNFIDSLDKAACLATDQLDVENAERYGIQYMDSDNKRKYPVILHLSPSGAIERVIYALLEKSHMEHQAGKNPVLPLWLSPVQVRICPLNDSFIKEAEKVADKLEKECIRVDIDDRTESVQKKIRDAETDWCPLIVVLGEKEKKTKKYATRFRETGKVEKLDIKKLIKRIKDKTEGYPYKPLTLPRLLTKRPIFCG